MAKVKVAVANTIGKVISFDPNATVGATLGKNLFDADGSLLSLASLAAALIAAGVEIDFGEVSGDAVILETQIADGALLARVADDETITGDWTFTGNILIGTDWNFSDDVGIQFGNSADGRIYYSSAGEVRIDTILGAGFAVRTNGNEYQIQVVDGGKVDLGFNGATKLATEITGVAITGDITATTFGGITEANLLDKSANETITGDWTFSGDILVGTDWNFVDDVGIQFGNSADGRIYYSSAGEVRIDTILGAGFAVRTNGVEYQIQVIDGGKVDLSWNGGTKFETTSTGILVTGNVDGTTIGGITTANLLDKAATETISGLYTFTNGGGPRFQSVAPGPRWYETGAPTDEGNWWMVADGGGFSFRAYNDAFSAYDLIMQVHRTADIVDEVNFYTDNSTERLSIDTGGIRVNGDVFSTTIGGITQANLLDKAASESISGQYKFTYVSEPAPSALESMLTANFLHIDGKEVIDGNDTFIRLNQNNEFSSGVYTPYNFRADGNGIFGTAASVTALTVNGGTGGNSIAQFRRDFGGSAEAVVKIHGAGGLPGIGYTRDGGVAPWATGIGTASDFVIAQDTDTADTANYRFKISSTGQFEMNRRANSFTALTIGESSTLRGDAQDAFIDMYGEQTGVIYAARLAVFSSNMSLAGLGSNKVVNMQWYLNTQQFDGTYHRFYGSGNSNYFSLTHNDTDGILDMVSGTAFHIKNGSEFMATFTRNAAVSLRYNNVVELETQSHSATGVTSGALVDDHAGVQRDIGFNTLPTFNVDTADTLEANHCGKMNLKTNNSGIALTAEASSSTDFPVGGVTHMLNWGTSGNYSFTEGTGTTIWIVTPGTGAVDSAGGFSLQPGGFCTIWRYSATAYYCWGAELN